MAEYLFYHLERQRMDDVLPALLEKTLARGWRAVVVVADEARREALDRTLWTYRDDSFLPHAQETDGNAAHQPIVLSAAATNRNDAAVCFVDGGAAPQPEGYARIVLLFGAGDEAAVAAARRTWVDARAAGHEVTYWQQDENGRWLRRG